MFYSFLPASTFLGSALPPCRRILFRMSRIWWAFVGARALGIYSRAARHLPLLLLTPLAHAGVSAEWEVTPLVPLLGTTGVSALRQRHQQPPFLLPTAWRAVV